MKIKTYLIAIAVCCVYFPLFAQQGRTEFESKRLDAELDNLQAQSLVTALETGDAATFTILQTLFNPALPGHLNNALATDLSALKQEIYNAFVAINAGENVAVIFVYKGLTSSGTNFTVDHSSVSSKVFHGISQGGTRFSSYLLSTNAIYFILLDKNDNYYALTDAGNADKKLSEAVVKINYKTSYLKQSFNDLAKVWGTMGARAVGAAPETLKMTLIKVKPSRVKEPCDIILTSKAFKEDLIYTVHERNIASFQIGINNSKISANNLSINDGNLVIEPDEEQGTEWKSNAYALFEIHLPRDIDNFRPLWKTLLSKRPDDDNFAFDKWLYDNTISRIGLYGGVKIDKDPLSNLYAGFNYAITKELAVNFGWTWINEYIPQVTAVGDITSVGEALKYADRRYSGAKFSIGISFSPSVFATTLGIKNSSEDSGD